MVLVAEDDESNFKLIKAIIGKRCELVWAKTGVEAIDYYKQHQADVKLILMDIKMPDMNGLEATKAIRQLDAELPILMQTAYAFSHDKDRALEAGANVVLVKPITVQTLRKAVADYLPELGW